ncbi:MAG: metallophosphoesterase [Polaromonas sp.]|uniref:metallophosphoesterase n=1 Tax=Polaromonas sp. TaxID=1869339 RepID=UPI002489A636|nr:metallophosphoesterase [Polaromonas sp.]MDI1270514.1 metallophosphoesterase [Polaromonas sp.]
MSSSAKEKAPRERGFGIKLLLSGCVFGLFISLGAKHEFPGESLISPAHGADLLVLAGDIGSGTQAIDLFKDWSVPVLFLAGNHEFYGHSIEKMRIDLRSAAQGHGTI